jgi:hypothetical protein
MDVSHGKLCRLAAAFAMSNMGHQVPETITKDIQTSDDKYIVTPRSEVEQVAGHLMESDEHEDLFAQEAEMWYKDLKGRSNEEVLKIWGDTSPWIQKIIDA